VRIVALEIQGYGFVMYMVASDAIIGLRSSMLQEGYMPMKVAIWLPHAQFLVHGGGLTVTEWPPRDRPITVV